MTIPIADLWKYELRKGNSPDPSQGACLFDAGMWLVYGKIGDNPPCSCPVIRQYAISLNDYMPDAERQRLKPFILRVVGNRDPGAEAARLHFIVLETARRVVPLALEKCLPEHAARLRALPDDASYETIRVAADAAAYAADAAADAAAYAAARAAADAAARVAADAADAADAAADAADAAARVAAIAAHAVAAWAVAIDILDGALRIGKQSPEFDEAEVRASVDAFERARHMSNIGVLLQG